MLKKTFKRITAILLALTMMVSFAACGGSETNTGTNKPANSEATIDDGNETTMDEFVDNSEQNNHGLAIVGLPFDTDVLPTCDMWTFNIQTPNGLAEAYFCFLDDGWVEFGYEITPGTYYEAYYEGHWIPSSDNIVQLDMYLLSCRRTDYNEREEINTYVAFWYDESTEALHMAYHSGDVLYDLADVTEFTLYRSSFDF